MKKKMRFKKRYIIISLATILCILFASVYAIANHLLNQINYEDESDVSFVKTDLTDEEYEKYLKSQKDETPIPDTLIDDEVINILLIGEENMKGSRGRSDSMMIATINPMEKTLKLTSIMRDIYIPIPGYRDNKLNAAFNKGGGVLLSKTIEKNFNIKLDGYVRVDFKGFEKIINELGGVDIKLTDNEAKYLNTTNYISNSKYHTVKSGMNHVNGNQALGYCRVRYRKANNNECDDYGRTYRQRSVLSAIYKEYRSKSYVEMLSIANKILPYVTTNLTKDQIVSYFSTAISLGATKLETLRIPANNTFVGGYKDCGSPKLSSVLVIDFNKNKNILKDFIYKDDTSVASKK